MYIEITPTDPLPDYPDYLDGDTTLWDEPQLAYLDGNTLPGQGITAYHSRVVRIFSSKSENTRRYNYNFPHDKPALCTGPGTVYFDGNKARITNTMYHGGRDGNAPARVVHGLDIPGFKFDEMTYRPDTPWTQIDYIGWHRLSVRPGQVFELEQGEVYSLKPGGNPDVTTTIFKVPDFEYFIRYLDPGSALFTAEMLEQPDGEYGQIKLCDQDWTNVPATLECHSDNSIAYGIYNHFHCRFIARLYHMEGKFDDNWQPGSDGTELLIKTPAKFRINAGGWYHYGPTTTPVASKYGMNNFALLEQEYDKSIDFGNGYIKKGAVYPEQVVTAESWEWHKIKRVPVIPTNIERIEDEDGELLEYMYKGAKIIQPLLLASPYSDGSGMIYPDKVSVKNYTYIIFDPKNLGTKTLADLSGFPTSPEILGETEKGVMLIDGLLYWVKIKYPNIIESKEIIYRGLPKNKEFFKLKAFNKYLAL